MAFPSLHICCLYIVQVICIIVVILHKRIALGKSSTYFSVAATAAVGAAAVLSSAVVRR